MKNIYQNIREKLALANINDYRLDSDKIYCIVQHPKIALEALDITLNKFKNKTVNYKQLLAYWYKVVENKVGHDISNKHWLNKY